MQVDEFWEKYADEPYELIDGKVVPTPEKDPLAQEVIRLTAEALAEVVDNGDTEDILAGSVGCAVANNSLIAPDITFLTEEQLTHIPDPESYVPFAPDFAIEAQAETMSDTAMLERVKLYLEGGARLVWVLHPAKRELTVHSANGQSESYSPGNTVSASPCINERFAVRDFFPQDS